MTLGWRIASQSRCAMSLVTVLSWFAVRANCAVENWFQEAIDLDRHRNHAKNFSREFPFKINIVCF
jgi:hypothetical protein